MSRPLLPLLLSLWLGLPAASLHAAPLEQTTLKGGAFDRQVSVSITNLPLQDAIRLVAQKGRLNLVIEDELRETVNLELREVRLGDALEALLTMGGAQALWRGNVMAIVGRKKALQRGILASSARIFKLRYASAQRIAEFLNTSALTGPYMGLGNSQSNQTGQQLELAKADPRTNTVLVLGTPADIQLAERTIQAMDLPPEQRIYKLSHANAAQVASILNATIFNNGNKGSSSEQLRVDIESVTEGTGGGSNTGSGVELTNLQAALRNRSAQTQTVPVEAKHSVAVPDSRTNSVIVMGSAETLRLADALVPQLDRQLRQVAIDVELVELTTQDARELGLTLSGQSGNVTSNFDPTAVTQPGWNVTYDPASALPNAFRLRLNAMLQDRRARLLAHPTILASDNTESQINIVDEVIKGTKISNQTVTVGGQSFVMVEPIFGVAGVTLNILPKIGDDETVTLRLHPTVSSVRETQRDGLNNQISLLSRRELIAQQVTVRSGSSLALGGLTQTSQINGRTKLPILGDIPFLGNLFSTHSGQSRQTELMIVVTPHVKAD